MNPDWIVPDWPAPPWLGAIFSTRAGGVSKPPFDKLNLGDHVGDVAGDVVANRANFTRQIGARPVFLNQVHKFDGVTLTRGTPNHTVADACITRTPGVACTIMVADCLPVLFADRLGTVVGAAHAGWRGLLGEASPDGPCGVLEKCYKKIRDLAVTNLEGIAIKDVANEVFVWFGPCIGASNFEVGDEVRDAFVALDPRSGTLFHDAGAGKWLADLPGLARQRLNGLGVAQIYGNDGSQAWCTVANPSRFFSHRRDHLALGSSGRMAACIWIE